jgi:hypothetical protein
MRVRVTFEIETFSGVTDDEALESLKRSVFYLAGNSKYWIDRNKTIVEKERE